MASTTTRGAHYLILLLSVPLLYFICQSILPKRSTRDQQPLDRADLSTGTDAAALDGAGADPVVKQPVRTPRVKRPAPPAPRAEATDGEDEEAPAKKGTGRSGSLQGRLANGALQQLRSKFNFKDPLCQIFQSQHNQDWFAILNFFTNVKDGFYVDVGANHFQIISNTWFLDHCMGWRGICVEPNPDLAKLLRQKRSCYVYNGCISTFASNLTLIVPIGGVHVAGHIGSDAEVKKGERKVSVPCMSLSALLEQQNVEHVHFMSLDVEGHEPNAIASFPTDKPPIDILSIEISTGRIQRALSQYPLLTRNMVSLVPLVGDAIMVRRGFAPLYTKSKLLFPYTPYFEQWWYRLCMTFEKMPKGLCTKLGLDYIDKPRFPPPKEEAHPQSSKKTFLQFASEGDEECQRMVEQSESTDALSAAHSQDWFALHNFFAGGTGLEGRGFYVEVVPPGAPWGLGSNTWFLDHCLGWEGVCVVSDAAQAEEWNKHRSCQVKMACTARHCAELGCRNNLCKSLQCGVRNDTADCQDLSTVLKGDTPVDVLSMDVMYAPYIVGMAESWAQVRRAAVVLVNGTPKTNYKLMHWPLSLRGYALAATFAGNDVFIQRTRRLLKRRMVFPSPNSTAIKWLTKSWEEYGLQQSVIDALVLDPR